MSHSQQYLQLFFVSFLFLVTVVFLPGIFLSSSILYTKVLTPGLLLFIGSPVKLFFLFLGFLFTFLSARLFNPDNPVRPAWIVLAAGFFLYLTGQSILGYYQLIIRVPTPFPSYADLFFLTGTFLFLVSLIMFIVIYNTAGFPVGEKGEIIITSILFAFLFTALAYWVLVPILGSSEPFFSIFISVLYPVVDLLLLLPIFILVRMSLRMKGSRQWSVWAKLTLGFMCFLMGDILFAFFAMKNMAFLDPLMDHMYLAGYIFTAWGVSIQYYIMNEK